MVFEYEQIKNIRLANFANAGTVWRKESNVPTRNISLTPEQDDFIDEVLATGEYRNASEAVRDAIRALQQRRTLDALRLERLRLSIQHGIAAFDRGAFTEVEDADLDSYLDGLDAPMPR